MLKIGLFPNTKKQNINNVLNNMFDYFKKHNVEAFMLQETAKELGIDCPNMTSDIEDMKSKINVAITLGGDGTLLNAAREVVPAGIAICGVNMGRVGFLTEIELPELEVKLDKIIRGNYKIEERLMLDAVVFRDGQAIYEAFSLNDIVINKGGLSRMINLNLFIDDEITAKYPADGLIIATSTGSTGYSLSSGGPIINPKLEVVAITPICSHTMLSRSLIVSADEKIKIKPQAPHDDIILTIDGQNMCNLLPDDTVLVKKSRFKARFIHFSGKSYYETLRVKLRRVDINED